MKWDGHYFQQILQHVAAVYRSIFFDSMIALITCAGHGNDGPIEGLRESVEHGVGLVLLKRVAQAREDQHTHAHSHAQEKKFPGRRIM